MNGFFLSIRKHPFWAYVRKHPTWIYIRNNPSLVLALAVVFLGLSTFPSFLSIVVILLALIYVALIVRGNATNDKDSTGGDDGGLNENGEQESITARFSRSALGDTLRKIRSYRPRQRQEE